MKNLGEIFIGGRNVNLDSTSIEELEKYLNEAQNKKEQLKSQLDCILEEIYN